ncbi:MAG: hypothetical protein K8R36_01785 [Planctomycetales bacterium]|nr:hypothetical protein [Planctomycetales bacterium]
MNNEVEEFLRRAAARRAQVEAQMRAQAEARARGQQMPPPQQPQQQIPVAYSPQQYPPQQPPVQYGQARPAPPRMTAAPQSLSQQQAYSKPSMAQTVVAAELAEDTDRVAASVAAHLRGSQQISEHTAHLSDKVDSTDDVMDARLHQTFDHQVGRLKKTTEATPDVSREDSNATASVVAKATVLGIAHMLQNPQNIRSAIILNEVFNRPTDRW